MTTKRKVSYSLAILFLIGIYFQTQAQQRNAASRIHKPNAETYLSGGQIGDKDSVSVSRFDSLLAQPLLVKDSLGQLFPVHSFGFIYVNRGVYSDSTGHPIILSDYLYSTSIDGLLPDYWRKGLISQVKAGDSAIFTDIRYFADTTSNAPLLYGNTMKLFITH